MSLPKEILELFEPIALEEMEKVRLMNRIDSKFVTNTDKLIELLKIASNDFLLQEIDGKRNMPYSSCYYDTPDRDMFYQHQRGKKRRQKVRTRLYEGSMDVPFLEIKSKNNKGRTKKKRVLMEDGEEISIYQEFMEKNCGYELENLSPVLTNHFYRLTLVNKDMTERITIDTDLEINNLITGNRVELPDTVIIEWKRDGVNSKSGLGLILRSLHIRQMSFSKYCLGMAMTNPDLKQNRVKKNIRMINRVSDRVQSL